MVKGGLKKVIEKDVIGKAENMTKLRFVKKFEKQDYVKINSVSVVKKLMKIRLNMIKIGENYRGKDKEIKAGANWCVECDAEKETTEHVIDCD